MAYVGNLYTNVGCYFELSFVTVEMDNLDVKLGITLRIFLIPKVGNFFYKL
jgi:hypothetical protein